MIALSCPGRAYLLCLTDFHEIRKQTLPRYEHSQATLDSRSKPDDQWSHDSISQYKQNTMAISKARNTLEIARSISFYYLFYCFITSTSTILNCTLGSIKLYCIVLCYIVLLFILLLYCSVSVLDISQHKGKTPVSKLRVFTICMSSSFANLPINSSTGR